MSFSMMQNVVLKDASLYSVMLNVWVILPTLPHMQDINVLETKIAVGEREE